MIQHFSLPSFFTTSSNLSDKELEGLRKIVDQELKKRKDD